MAIVWMIGFLAMLLGGALVGIWPTGMPTLYIVASFITFIAYALDKAAAQQGRRRIRERTLQLLSLAGGWPGALIAQNVLRHKSKKRTFLSMFWLMVVSNCIVLSLYLAAINQTYLRPYLVKLLFG